MYGLQDVVMRSYIDICMMAISCDLYMYACSMYVYMCVVMDFCIYYDILDTIMITDKMLLHFKHSKLGQILHVDKTCFLRPGNINKW